MKILGIATILPIPGLLSENDVILRLYRQILKECPDCSFHIARPTMFPFPSRALMDGSWLKYLSLHTKGHYVIDGFHVDLLPGVTVKAPLSVRSFLTQSFYVLNQPRLWQWVKDDGIDLVHANYAHLDGYIAWRLFKSLNVPYTLTVRNEVRFFQHRSTRQVLMEILRCASGVVTPTYDVYRFLEPLCGGKLSLIPHGIEEEFIVEQRQDRAPDSLRLLSVCRLLPLKNIDKILVALAHLQTRYSFHYTLIGDGPEHQRIMTMVDQLGLVDRFTYIARVAHEEMPSAYASHDAFVLCSYPETFGRVYFEAMAAGLPIVCANQFAVNGFFSEGISGYSVDPSNQAAITDTLETLLKDPTRVHEMGAQARATVRHYTWQAVAQEYLAQWRLH